MPASRCPQGTQLLFGETGAEHPFVDHEQMMPFVPFVRVSNVDRAIALAKESEHGFGHTAILHSRDTSVMSRMGKIMDCTIFVVNGPCTAGLGTGGEGVLSFSIAGPTGEGVTTPLTFCRQRRIERSSGSMTIRLTKDRFRTDAARARGRHGDSDGEASDVPGERMLVVQLETAAGGPTASRSWRSTGWGRAGATWCWSPTTAGLSRNSWGRPRRAAGA